MAESERKTIKVVSVGTTREIKEGGAKVTQFKCEDGVVYEVWGDTLLEHVKVDATLEVDVVYSEGKDAAGTVYPHHKVTQIYIESKPVKVKTGRQGGWQGRSPEERASTESQTAANIVSQLLIAGKLDHDSPLVKMLKDWLNQKLTHQPPPQPVEEPKAASKKESPKESPPQQRQFKDLWEFLTACDDELGLAPSDIRKELSIADLKTIKDYIAAWISLLPVRKKGGESPP